MINSELDALCKQLLLMIDGVYDVKVKNKAVKQSHEKFVV